MKDAFTSQTGLSLIEIIVSMAIFALIAATMVSLVTGGFQGFAQGAAHTQASALADEAVEALRAIRDTAWNEFIYSTSSVSLSGGWQFDGEGTTEVIGEYTRIITFANVCRDGSNDMTVCPGVYTDVNTKQVTVTVRWQNRVGGTSSVERVFLLSNWESDVFTQTDWSGGTGQSIWSDETEYETDDGNIDYATPGQISLTSTGGGDTCGTKVWGFDAAGGYVYDVQYIEVAGSEAHLFETSTPGMAGATTNTTFDVDTSGWVYVDSEESGNSVDGTHQLVGGNPNRYIEVVVGKKKSVPLSGYWEQSFVTTIDNPSVATTTFDWIVSEYSASFVTSFELYVFVDTVSGAPTVGQEIWSSGPITSVTSWASVPDIDISSKLGVAGTYYLKVGVRVITTGGGGAATGTNVAGFDNVVLHWHGDSIISYPNDAPSISPNTSYTVPSVSAWTSFSETANKHGGEVYYQLSDDDGSTWQYWDGANWSVAGVSDYTTAIDVNDHIASFSTSTAQIVFRAFLSGDGSQQVSLEEVQIGCAESQTWPFSIPLNYSYDTNDIEVTGGVAQLIDHGTGGSCGGSANACTSFGSELSCEDQSGCSWSVSTISGDTKNTDVDADSSGWKYADWEEKGKNVDGNWQAKGGNPDGYIDVSIQKVKSKSLSGYWEQPFDVSVDSPSIATLVFDYIVSEYSASFIKSFQLYVFVDAASGAPILGTEVWSSGEMTDVTRWDSVRPIDVSAQFGRAGTYYLKLAVRVVTGGGGGAATGVNTAGYDNVWLHWEDSDGGVCGGTAHACTTFLDAGSCGGQSGCSWSGTPPFAMDSPSISPAASLITGTSTLGAWTSFSESANKNGGEVYYQLSDDDGGTWQYWDGAAWAFAGASEYSTASIVNSHIASFSTSTQQLLYRAFLSSDGTQQVQLDAVTIGWTGGQNAGAGGYAMTGYLVSSAFSMGGSSPLQTIAWDEDTSACTPTCSVRVQLRTAPDSGGSPGSWTTWHGANGSGTYFTNNLETIISTDLNWNDWLQYRIELIGDGTVTPVLEEIRLNYR